MDSRLNEQRKVEEKAMQNLCVAMRFKLEKNRFKKCPKMDPDGKNEIGRTWTTCSPEWVLLRLKQEVLELEEAIRFGKSTEILEEAADVANFAMIIHDIYGCEGM